MGIIEEINKLSLEERINKMVVAIEVIKSRVHHFPCQEHSKDIREFLVFKNKLMGVILASNLGSGLIAFLVTYFLRK